MHGTEKTNQVIDLIVGGFFLDRPIMEGLIKQLVTWAKTWMSLWLKSLSLEKFNSGKDLDLKFVGFQVKGQR